MTSYRLATPDDAGAIARLHAESWRSSYRGLYPDAYLDGEVFADRAAVWQQRFSATKHPAALTLVAEEGGEVIAFAHSLVDDDPEWGTLLDNLHVHPERKRLGIGRGLMAETAAWVQDAGSTLGLYLWVLEGNTPARLFYDALGGRVTGRGTSDEGGSSVPSLRYWWPNLRELLPSGIAESPKRNRAGARNQPHPM
jgi:GNAT superfamily N-acetyltransferase